jgi:hypothetical protein
MSATIASSKKQAQETLKYLMEKRVLFTLKDQRPQRYYPACMKAKVIDSIAKRENALMKPTGVNPSPSPIQNLLRQQSSQSFLDILLSLPNKPLYIHKLQLQTSIARETYNDIDGKIVSGNRAKQHDERIGNSLVTYLIYPNGKVIVSIACSNRPFKIDSDTDEMNLFSYFGQVRDRLIYILSNSSESMVPLVTDWFLMQCDINKDIEVASFFPPKDILQALNSQLSNIGKCNQQKLQDLDLVTSCVSNAVLLR